eukprot:maker-scaffold723_size106546-snap-gene-0.22 protein:Tk01427 transcript:maker-scaffold723_size106546-snap-gene-0.22-mRNA-1 annotation:"Hypothetical protein CBG01951"
MFVLKNSVVAHLQCIHTLETSQSEQICTCPSQFTLHEDECVPCKEDATAYLGFNLLDEPILVETEADCALKCSEHQQCLFWSLDTQNGRCYLKYSRDKNAKLWHSYVSGVDNCAGHSAQQGRILIPRDLSEYTLEFESKGLDPHSVRFPESENHRHQPASRESSSSPLLYVYLSGQSRSVLQGIPATFGKHVGIHFEGQAIETVPWHACNNVSLPISPMEQGFQRLFAIVERGNCKFAEKAKRVQDAGFQALIVLDNRDHSGFKRITGRDESIKIPVIFLLKKESDKIRRMLLLQKKLRVAFEDSRLFTPFEHNPDPTPHRGDHLQNPTVIHFNKFRTKYPLTVQNDPRAEQTVGVEFSPIMVAVIVVIIILIILVIITLFVYIKHCASQNRLRRQRRNRCQDAVRDMEAHYKSQLGKFYPEEINGSRSHDQSDDLDSHQTTKLLECPVCLEVAW